MWNQHSTFENAECAWEERATSLKITHPLKVLKNFPTMPGITEDTAKHLTWKSLKWILLKDHDRKVLKGFLKHPFRYLKGYIRSLLSSKKFTRSGDFFLYNITSFDQFEKLLQNKDHLFVMGFSYCHKPFECPSGRFTDQCINQPDNPVCGQCFIGKCLQASNQHTIPLIIPTVHYIGAKMLDIVNQNPHKKVLFLITACEMTLTMFADWGNMIGIQGLGVRLDGRICNTLKAFELSEEGIKPGLTVVLDDTKKRMLDFIRLRRTSY